MAKSRKLPARWFFKHGAYYYVVPKGQEAKFGGKRWFRLGKTESESYMKWAGIVGDSHGTYSTMNKLFDRYMVEVVSGQSPATQTSKLKHMKNLRAFFGKMQPNQVKPIHVHQFLDIRIDSPVSANREIATLSHVFSKAIRWGVLEVNPCTGKKIEKHKEKPRDRYVTDEEFLLFFNEYAGDFLQSYLRVKFLIGQRKSDVLRIKKSDITEDGIFIANTKTGKRFLIAWSDELREAIDHAKSQNKKIASIYLFSTREGKCYVDEEKRTTSGFDSIWQRRMQKFAKDGNERFNEHDIRAKTASDAEADHANELMQHSSKALTEKVYRRKMKVVQPFKRASKE